MKEDWISDEALRGYAQRREQDFKSCQQALAQKDLQVIQSIGHKMKGNGSSFGFPELSVLGDHLESACLKNDIPWIIKELDEFSIWLQKNQTLLS